MAEIPSSESVGRAFVEQYYSLLHIKPEESYRFYENSSVATWDAKDGATTLEGIREMIISSDFKDGLVEIEDIHAQNSLQGSVLVVVTGLFTGKDHLRRKFSHTFLLSKQDTGFFVLNDILRFVDIHLPLTALQDGDDKELKSPLIAESEPAQISNNVCMQEKSALIDGKSVTESTDSVVKSVSDSTDSKGTSEVVTKPSSGETPPEQTVSEVVSDVKEAAAKSSYLEMLSKGRTCSTPAPATRFVRVSALDGLPEEEKAKLLALSNGSRRAMALASIANSETKPETPPTNTAAENIHAPKGIYVGGLPANTTINDLTHAVRIFGEVKKFDGVQVILSENQYCFGFVHFQSADSAKKAVEAQVITVNGKEAHISYKRSGRRAADGNDNRGRSPSGRGELQSRTPSRDPSCNGHSPGAQNVEVRQYNNGGEANRWNDQRRDQRGCNGYAYQRNDQRRDQRGCNGYAYQRNDQRRYQRARNGEAYQINDQRRDQRARNGEAYQRNDQRRDQRVRNAEQNDQRGRHGEAVRDQRSSSCSGQK